MEKIDGIELARVADKIEASLQWEIEEAIGRQIKGIWVNINNWRFMLKENEKQSASLNEKVSKAIAKLDEIKKENWSVLHEIENKQAKQTEAKDETE